MLLSTHTIDQSTNQSPPRFRICKGCGYQGEWDAKKKEINGT